MAKKPFEIQSPTLRIGGVELEAGNNSIVIPGVTVASTYQADEVSKYSNDTTVYTQGTPTAIDQYTYLVYLGQQNPPQNWVPALYTVTLDDDNKIDEIEIDGDNVGSYPEAAVSINEDNMIISPSGASVAQGDFDPDGDWVATTFYVKMRAGEIENVGGGGSGINFDDDDAINLQGHGTIRNAEGPVNLVSNQFAQLQWTTTNGVEESNPNNTDELINWVYVDSDGAWIETNENSQSGTNTWLFNNDGELHFPDGTIQTTAYTGQSGGSIVGPLYIMANTDGNIATSSDGTTWSSVFDTGIGIGTVAIGPNKIIYTRSDINGDAYEGGETGLYVTSSPTTTPTLILGTDQFEGANLYWNQIQYFEGTSNPWVAVGYVSSVGNSDVPIVAYSSDAASWSFIFAGTDVTAAYTGSNLRFTDVAFGNNQYLISADSDGVLTGKLWVISNLSNSSEFTLSGNQTIDADDNFKAVEYFSSTDGWNRWNAFTYNKGWYATSNPDPSVGSDWGQYFGSSGIEGVIQSETGLSGQTVEEATSGQVDGIWYWLTTSSDGHVVWWPNAPEGPYVSIPKPYTGTITSFSQSETSNIDPQGDGAPGYLAPGEKFTITGSSVAGYNGTFYTDGNYFVFTDSDLTIPFDTSELDPFTGTATITWSHGTYIDSVGYANNKFYCANDDEQIFEGVFADGNLIWTKVDDKNNNFMYWNDFAYYSMFANQGANTGNFSFNGDTISNPAGMFLISDRGTLALGTDMEIPGNPIHFHIAFEGSNSDPVENDLFLGDDFNYVKVRGTYGGVGVDIGTNDRDAGSQHVWNFNTDGTVTFPTLTVPISDNATPSGTGQTIKFGNSTQQAIIHGPSSTIDYINAERVIIQGAPGYTDTTGEGGDVYLWAGPGGSAGGDGGDIKIRAGRGIASGNGGYLNFQAGNSVDGNGGYINIESGSSGNGTGGNITIDANSGGQLGLYTAASGNITLNTAGGVNVWTFDSTGKTTLPGAVVKSTVAKTYTDPTIYDMFFEVVAVNVNGVVTGINVTNSPNANWLYGTGSIILNDVNISIAVDGGGNASVTINDGGSGGHFIGETASLPGIAFGAPAIENSIDLTKSINKLVEGQYTLVDGVEGQILYLKMQPNQDPNNIWVLVANSNLGQGRVLIPFIKFDPDIMSNVETFSFCTLIFADGEWTQSGGMWDS